MRVPVVPGRMVMPEPDLDEDPDAEEPGSEPKGPSGRERPEAAPSARGQRSEHDREHDEVGEVGVDRGRAEADRDSGLIRHVQEKDRNPGSQHDRAGRYASVRKPGRQRDGDYTLA